MSAANEKTVTDFCNSLRGRDMNKLVSYLTEDVFYHNVPWQPVHGHAGVREVLTPFVEGKKISLEKMDIKNTSSSGNVVMNERIEHWVAGSVKVELPVVGVFTFNDQGKIFRWCDYFDAKTAEPMMEALK
jgi:limonene-1,2-epoxide hydrolase